MKLFSAISLIALGAFVISVSSCVSYKIEMADVYKYQDSTVPLIPTAQSVQAKAEGESDAPHTLTLIMGVGGFYDAPIEQKQEAAIKAGQIALRIFGERVATGKLVLTKQARNHKEIPDDAIIIDMRLDSLRQAMEPKK